MAKRILLAAPRGYCAGVDRAVITVEKHSNFTVHLFMYEKKLSTISTSSQRWKRVEQFLLMKQMKFQKEKLLFFLRMEFLLPSTNKRHHGV